MRKMKMELESLLILLVLVLGGGGVVADASASDKNINIWPMPASATYGQQTVCVGAPKLSLLSSHDPDAILSEAFRRMIDLLPFHSNSSSSSCSHPRPLEAIHVVLLSPHPQLQYGVDESYKLLVPSPHDPRYALLEAQTVYGALHGLQTFSQLCQYNFATRTMELRMAPWDITDQPRFSFRGLLIDTSRHYQPPRVIKKVIDSMAYAKLNVLHWHIVDTQSFPLEIPSFPKLWDGAYSPAERYSMADAADIVRYAQRRGINVLAEIDVPGHALSWGSGYPALWPSKDCQQPLDVSNEFTFKVIDGILSDFSKVFPFKFVHMGGDEVNTTCWTSTPHIRNWLKQKGMDEEQAYQYFVLRGQQIALKHGYEMVNWEETFSNFGPHAIFPTLSRNPSSFFFVLPITKAPSRKFPLTIIKPSFSHPTPFFTFSSSHSPLTRNKITHFFIFLSHSSLQKMDNYNNNNNNNNNQFWQFSDQLRLQGTNLANLSLNDSIWSSSKRLPEERKNFDVRVGAELSSTNNGKNSDWNGFNDVGWKLGFSNPAVPSFNNNNNVAIQKVAGAGGLVNDGFSKGTIYSKFNNISNNNNNSVHNFNINPVGPYAKGYNGNYVIGKGKAEEHELVGVKTGKKNAHRKNNNNNNNNNGHNDEKESRGGVDKRFKTLPPAEALPRNETIGGYIFVCNNDTMQENLRRQLFGLPPRYRDSVRAITPGLPLFLYNYSTHQLHGVFEAASFGGTNIDPSAWEDKKCLGESRFPAQVRVITRKICEPLEEDSFRPILHHYDGPKFRLELNIPEALSLLDIFSDQDA